VERGIHLAVVPICGIDTKILFALNKIKTKQETKHQRNKSKNTTFLNGKMAVSTLCPVAKILAAVIWH